jgi:hypothetical protein
MQAALAFGDGVYPSRSKLNVVFCGEIIVAGFFFPDSFSSLFSVHA